MVDLRPELRGPAGGVCGGGPEGAAGGDREPAQADPGSISRQGRAGGPAGPGGPELPALPEGGYCLCSEPRGGADRGRYGAGQDHPGHRYHQRRPQRPAGAGDLPGQFAPQLEAGDDQVAGKAGPHRHRQRQRVAAGGNRHHQLRHRQETPRCAPGHPVGSGGDGRSALPEVAQIPAHTVHPGLQEPQGGGGGHRHPSAAAGAVDRHPDHQPAHRTLAAGVLLGPNHLQQLLPVCPAVLRSQSVQRPLGFFR